MEMYISKKKILEDARSGNYFPEIHSQMARETRSEKATTSGYYYSQVFLIHASSVNMENMIYLYFTFNFICILHIYIMYFRILKFIYINFHYMYLLCQKIQFVADLLKDSSLGMDRQPRLIKHLLNWQNRNGLLDSRKHYHRAF